MLVAIMTIEVNSLSRSALTCGRIDVIDGDDMSESILGVELSFIATLTLEHITS